MKIKSLFNWEIPSNKYDSGFIHCSRKLGSCGKWHEFEIGNEFNNYEIEEFNLSWEAREGECEKFEEWLEDEVREKWRDEIKDEYLKIIGEQEIEEKEIEKKLERQRLIKEGVSLKETQWEKGWGAVRPVGFYKNRQEIFICGNCSKELKGSLRNGRVKNRNNPAFWGLETRERVLCGKCLEKRKGEMPVIRPLKIFTPQYVKKLSSVGGSQDSHYYQIPYLDPVNQQVERFLVDAGWRKREFKRVVEGASSPSGLVLRVGEKVNFLVRVG